MVADCDRDGGGDHWRVARLVRWEALLLAGLTSASYAAPPRAALAYQSILVREAHFSMGMNAPIPMLAAQIEQESGWNPNVTAWDNGRGLAQFMDGTAEWASKEFPDLGKPEPYQPSWAIRALVRLDFYNFNHVKGATACERWGAALKGYNAGLGFVLRAQEHSTQPLLWFDHTELLNEGQSEKNWEYSRQYPRWILYKRQSNYLPAWGAPMCLPQQSAVAEPKAPVASQ